MMSLLLTESYRPSCVCIGRVVSVLGELLCIGRVCRLYDFDSFCHINTVFLIVNNHLKKRSEGCCCCDCFSK